MIVYKFSILDFSWGGLLIFSIVAAVLIRWLFFSSQTRRMKVLTKIAIITVYSLIFLLPLFHGVYMQAWGVIANVNGTFQLFEGEIEEISGDTRLQIIKVGETFIYNESSKMFCYTNPLIKSVGVGVGDKIHIKFVGELSATNGKGACILEITKLNHNQRG